jgi:hypothetical protein
MQTPQRTRRDITRIRNYLANGFPASYKLELRAELRNLEYQLDKAEYRNRENN